MELLSNEIKKNGFTYRQVKRNEKAAIYAQCVENDQNPIAYEVFKIRCQKENTSLIGGVEVIFKAKELFPSDEEFGRTAWSFVDPNLAESRFIGIS